MALEFSQGFPKLIYQVTSPLVHKYLTLQLMKYVILLYFMLLSFSILAEQNNCTINGFVKDSESGESIIGAHVLLESGKIGTASNTFGYYSLANIPCKKTSICISAIGYQTKCIEVINKQDSLIEIYLAPISLGLDEVAITAERIEDATQPNAPIHVKASAIKFLPNLGGESDPMKALHALPSVQQGNEGTAGVYVRGGTPDQNLILLDGVPVYNTSHLFGFLSVFNADAINDMKVYIGDIPAKYGERLSSVIDINLS